MKKIVTLTVGTTMLCGLLLSSGVGSINADKIDYKSSHSLLIKGTNNHSMGELIKKDTSPRINESSGISAAETGRPSKDFIDVSSNNGEITKEEFQIMKNKYGIKGVIVKLTEGNVYKNPEAPKQIANAKAAGLKVSVYHFSWFDSTQGAIEEAQYFLDYAKELNLDGDTSFVNDYEKVDAPLESNPTSNSLKFAEVLKSGGYKNVYHYSSKNWFSSVLDMKKLGAENCWIAEWPMNPTEDNLLNTSNAAWQWANDLYFPELGDNRQFDISTDYLNAFT